MVSVRTTFVVAVFGKNHEMVVSKNQHRTVISSNFYFEVTVVCHSPVKISYETDISRSNSRTDISSRNCLHGMTDLHGVVLC